MGWKLKALAVILGLMLFSVAWPVSALLFLYAASGLLVKALRRGGRGSKGAPALQQGERPPPTVRLERGLQHPLRRGLGVVFLLLSAVAVADRGTYSPLVFGGVGAVLLLWGTPLVRPAMLGSLRPVEESVLLRRAYDPVHWFAVAEVKLATKQVGRALGGVDETLLVTSGDAGHSIFVVLEATSLTLGGAEESLLSRLRELTRVSAPLGAYLLPLDPERAVAGLLRLSVEPVDLPASGWPMPLSTTDYDLLTVDARRGFVRSVGAYKRSDRGTEGATLPPTRQTLSRPALLWEVFQELGRKVEWQKPDGCTTFLASMFATGGETIGQRVSEAGDSGDQRQVLVQSLGTPPVQISRAQLRAIARIYS